MSVQESKPPVDKPTTGDYSSSGGGSSTIPAPQFSFILPANAYKGDEIKLEPTSRYVKSVVWTVRKDGVSLELDKVLNGVLNENGGSISFLDTGNFVLTATAVNSRGKEIKHEQSIHIYPVITTGFSLPKTAHTDTAVSVGLKTTDLGSNRVIWTLKKEGSEIDLADALNGELEADGGIVVFKNKGSYVLTASIADELGKTVSASQTITIYPVAQVKVTLPTVSHTDRAINFQPEVTDAEDMIVDFGLAAIGEILKSYDDPQALAEFLSIKQAEVQAQADETAHLLLLLDTAIKRLRKDETAMNYNVTVKTLPERYVASVRKVIPAYDQEGMLWGMMMTETAPLTAGTPPMFPTFPLLPSRSCSNSIRN